MFPPSRIVCLTEETVETIYLLGEQDRIVSPKCLDCAQRFVAPRARGRVARPRRVPFRRIHIVAPRARGRVASQAGGGPSGLGGQLARAGQEYGPAVP
jgi:hypothetical protein